MRRANFFAVASAIAVAGACGGKVVVDEPTGQGGGASSSSTMTTSTSVTTSTTSSEIATATVGGGGGGACLTCSAYVTDCIANPPPTDCLMPTFCAGSQPIFDDLANCVCAQCAAVCGATCGTGGSDTSSCSGCEQMSVMGPCTSQFAACENDV